MIDPEETEPNQDIEIKIRSALQTQDPDPLFVDRLQKKLADRFKDRERSTEDKYKIPERSPWLDKSKLLLSPLAWGAIGVIFVLFLIWGIRTLIPKVQSSISVQSSPSPMISPSQPVEPTQAVGGEGVIQLPTLAGMPVPWPEEAITSKNAAQITQLARWGRETINTIAWAPDGNSFAMASFTRIYIYDRATLKVINTIDNGSSVYQIAYSPDGTKLASGFNDTSVKIWDIASGSELLTLTGLDNFVTHIAFSPDGEILATGTYDNPIKLWAVDSGQELRTFGSSSISNFTFSPDGTMLATSGGEDKTVRLWDVASGQEIRSFTGHTDYTYGLAFSPDGTMLASTSNDLTIKLWDISTGKDLKTFNDQAIPSGVAFLPDNNTLVSTAEGEPITLWDINSGQVLRTIGDGTQGSNIVLSPDGKTILCNSVWQGEAIRLLDIASGKEIGKLDWQTYIVTSLDISPNGRIVAAGLDSGGIRLLNAINGQELRTLTGHTKGVASLAFSPDGTMLASASSDTTARLWDVSSGEELYSLEGVREFGWVGGIPSVDFSPDGKFLAFAGPSGQVKVWDVVNHQELRTLGGQAVDTSADEVAGVAFSPDGKILASGYSGGSITLWDAVSGQELRTLNHSSKQWDISVSTLQFSPDGKTLAAGYGYGNITLWDAASGREIRALPLPWISEAANDISSLVFSPDGSVLVIASSWQSIALFDAVSGNELVTLSIAANGLAFSPDGKLLISGGYDGAIRLWGMAPTNAIQQEVITKLPGEEVAQTQEPSPEVVPEELDVEKIPIPILVTGEGLQSWWWSPDGSYFPYSQQGPIGEPGPDQATNTLYFLDARTGEICPSIQETVTFTQTEWGSSPVGSGMFDRTTWMDDNHLMYINPEGELLALTPCNDSTDNLSASLPDKITSLSYGYSQGSQILLKGKQAYWLFTPSTRQSLKLGLPAPQEGREISLAWSEWEPKLISSRIEDRQGELWIILESIDVETGSTSLITEIQASPELQNGIPMRASINRTSKDEIIIEDSMTQSKLYNISSQTLQLADPYSDLFGIATPDMGAVTSWGRMGGAGEQDYHETLATGGIADGQYYIYHPESGKVDQYPLDPPLLVVFPNGEGGTVPSFVDTPQSNIFRVIMVDSGTEPYDLAAKGHPASQNSWSFATILPGAQKVMFSSTQGISLVDLKSGETLNFWGFENQVEYQDFYSMLSPDGKTVVGFASQTGGAPGVGSTIQDIYWLRLEP